MDQGLELSYWLGILGLALGSAQVLLWHTRRVLNRSRQDAAVHEVKVVPTRAVPEIKLVPGVARPDVRVVPVAVQNSAGSVIAS